MTIQEIKKYYPKKIDYVHKKIWLWTVPYGQWIEEKITEKQFDKYFSHEKEKEKRFYRSIQMG